MPAASKESARLASPLASTCPLLVTSLTKPFPNFFWAGILRSLTVECCGSDTLSVQPFGNEIVNRSISETEPTTSMAASVGPSFAKAHGHSWKNQTAKGFSEWCINMYIYIYLYIYIYIYIHIYIYTLRSKTTCPT